MDQDFDIQKYFTRNDQRHEYNVHVKHKVLSNFFYCDISDFSDFPCHELLNAFQLESLAALHDKVYPNLVRVFYTNMVYPLKEPGAFRTTVGNSTFAVTPHALNRFLKTMRQNTICVCTPKDFKKIPDIPESRIMEFVCRDSLISPSPHVHVLHKAQLSLDMQVLAEFVQCILLPRKGHMDTLTLLDVWVMGAIGLGIPIDIGFLICRYMQIARSHPQQSLPYGSIITLLLHKHHTAISFDEPSLSFTPRQKISMSTFESRHWEQVDGVWRIKPSKKGSEASSSKRARVGDEDEEEHEEDIPSASGPSLSADERHNLVMARLDSLATSIGSLATDIQTFRTATDQRLDIIERKINSLTGDGV